MAEPVTALSPRDQEVLRALLGSREADLTQWVLDYAAARDYLRYTAVVMDAWRQSVQGLSGAILGYLEEGARIPELGPDQLFHAEPAAQFGIQQARRHRARGVSVAMFLGLMKYYRQAYLDLLQVCQDFQEPARARLFVERCFDRVEIAFCTEWNGIEAEHQIHELSRANRELSNDRNKYLSLFNHLPCPVFMTDAQGWVVAMNQAGRQLLGRSGAGGLRGGQRIPWLEEDIQAFLALDRDSQTLERGYGSGPTSRHFEIRLQRVLDVSHRFQGLTLILTEITERVRHEALLRRGQEELEARLKERTRTLTHEISERKRIERQIREQATHDQLTGLPNRVLFMDRLQQAIAGAQRADQLMALLFIDLDRFKVVNDSLGHVLGDEILKQLARRLVLCIRESDTVARQGGDEFTAVLVGLKHPQDAGLVADKMLSTLSEPLRFEHHEISLGASIGITLFPSDAVDAEGLLRNADMAMYQAKESGRNRYQFFTQHLNEQALARLDMEQDLVQAVERQEFLLHYQPIIDLKQGRVSGAEALVRWQHPIKGLIRPDQFIPAAEETGLIDRLGEWVLATAATQALEWGGDGLERLTVAVNVSPRQIQLGLSPTRVRELLERTGLPPQRLTLEITETLLMEDRHLTLEWTRAVKDLGVCLAIDDFGTGYSSLSYLKRFPIDLVKIDRSFVREMARDPGADAMVEAILTIVTRLGLRAVAEGVESRVELERLRRLGCRYVQGYYFSPPKSLREFQGFVREWPGLSAPDSRPQSLPTRKTPVSR